MRVKYSPLPCESPEITELLKSPPAAPRGLRRPGLEAFVLTAARSEMDLTLSASRCRRLLKRDSEVALKEGDSKSTWCNCAEKVVVVVVFWDCKLDWSSKSGRIVSGSSLTSHERDDAGLGRERRTRVCN